MSKIEHQNKKGPNKLISAVCCLAFMVLSKPISQTIIRGRCSLETMYIQETAPGLKWGLTQHPDESGSICSRHLLLNVFLKMRRSVPLMVILKSQKENPTVTSLEFPSSVSSCLARTITLKKKM